MQTLYNTAEDAAVESLRNMRITGGVPLTGEVGVGSAKNAVLPELAACLLTDQPVRLEQVPELTDVHNMLSILSAFNAEIQKEGGAVTVSSPAPGGECAPECMQSLRASVLVMGPLLARTGYARLALPGGCAIGRRPIDLHIKGFREMGAKVQCEYGWVEARGKLKGAKIFLDLSSVGATENLMMAAALASGETIIENAAREPEIVDLAKLLNAMGAKIRGAGQSSIRIEGVKKLSGARHRPIPDRIEAGTLLCAIAATGGDAMVKNVKMEHLGAVLDKLGRIGLQLNYKGNHVLAKGRARKPFDLKTSAFPGFPTDLQAPMMALAATIPGTSTILENLFENRFMHAEQLGRMGANIQVQGRMAVVQGGKLKGSPVRASDLRAGAALAVAALAAEGETILEDAHLIDRGYANFKKKLEKLGAQISRF